MARGKRRDAVTPPPQQPKGEEPKPEAEAAAEATPKAGHNSTPMAVLTDDERRAILLNGVKKIEEFQEEMKSWNGKLRAERKRLKAHDFEKHEVDWALKLRSAEDDEVVEERRRQDQIARWLGHPVGSQLEMFDGVDRTPLVDRASTEGLNSGMAGDRCSPPYDMGTEAGQTWIAQWHVGQGILMSAFKKLEPQADGSFLETVEASGDPEPAANEATDGLPRGSWKEGMQALAAEGNAMIKGQIGTAAPTHVISE